MYQMLTVIQQDPVQKLYRKNFRPGIYYCLIMQTNPYPDTNFYSNIRDETAWINKYPPA